MNLINAGFNSYDVKELRFYCTEKFLNNKNYWHFKISSPEFLQVAITGDLSNLKKNSFTEYYTELNPNHKINGIYVKSVFSNQIEYFTPLNNERTGGFVNTPFGSLKFKKYWTIKGSNNDKPKYECGTEHSYTGGLASTTTNPNMVESHHTIWFRGKAPTVEQAQRRFLNKMKKQ